MFFFAPVSVRLSACGRFADSTILFCYRVQQCTQKATANDPPTHQGLSHASHSQSPSLPNPCSYLYPFFFFWRGHMSWRCGCGCGRRHGPRALTAILVPARSALKSVDGSVPSPGWWGSLWGFLWETPRADGGQARVCFSRYGPLCFNSF